MIRVFTVAGITLDSDHNMTERYPNFDHARAAAVSFCSCNPDGVAIVRENPAAKVVCLVAGHKVRNADTVGICYNSIIGK